MSIGNFYNQNIILLSEVASTGSYWSTSTGADYTTDVSIKAAVNLLSANEVANYGKIGFDAQYKAYTAVSTEVYGGRRCRWNGSTFDIIATPKNTLQKNHHFKILLRDVNNA